MRWPRWQPRFMTTDSPNHLLCEMVDGDRGQRERRLLSRWSPLWIGKARPPSKCRGVSTRRGRRVADLTHHAREFVHGEGVLADKGYLSPTSSSFSSARTIASATSS